MLNPEHDMNNIPYHESNRFYDNCNSQIYTHKAFWLGGPISILVNKLNIDSLINDYTEQYKKGQFPNDVILTQILNNNDFICRQPILGYENENGGTTFSQ